MADEQGFHNRDAALFLARLISQSPASHPHSPDGTVDHSRSNLEIIPVGDGIVGVVNTAARKWETNCISWPFRQIVAV